ncbi:MAG TPA: hypothetical protein GXZ56_11485 [Bacteroidales bacterium]|nr:hypothetical protein [Bacteroidales bacterium]
MRKETQQSSPKAATRWWIHGVHIVIPFMLAAFEFGVNHLANGLQKLHAVFREMQRFI